MAFSSLYQPFIQGMEMPANGRQRDDGALKRYSSVEDHRAWSMDKIEKSKFIHDVIKRQVNQPVPDLEEIGASIKEEYVDRIKSLVMESKVCWDFLFFIKNTF